MKSLKKLLFVVVCLLAVLATFGCNFNLGGNSLGGDDNKTKEETTKVDLQTVFDGVIATFGDHANIVSDLTLPSKVEDVSIVWTSDKPNVISNEGKVTRSLDDERVTLSCVLKYGEETKQFNVTLLVKGNSSDQPASYDKIEDVIKANDKTQATICGSVVAITKQSFLVKDATGFILVYKGKDWNPDLEAGNVVVVSGTITSYAGMKQFGTDATYEKQEGTTTDTPAFEDLDSAKFDALLSETNVKLVRVSGKLVKSGNYWNLEVAEATNKGSISYPVQNLDEFDGKNVEVTGYFVGVTGSSTKYINIILTAIKEKEETVVPTPGPDPEEPVEGTLAEIAASEVGKTYKTTAIVVALAKQGLLLKDASGLMYVYMGADLDSTIKVGTKLEVVGETSTYGGFVQFNKPTIEVKGEEEVTQPEPATLDKASYEALLTATSFGYYKFNAKLVISSDGKYYNLEFDGSEVAGSLVTPAMNLTSVNGSDVEIEAYFVYVAGSKTKYIYFIATRVGDVTGGEPTPDPEEPDTVAAIKKATVGEEYQVEATVIAIAKQGLLVKDDTDMIYVYMGADIDAAIKVGSKLDIKGTTSSYGGFVQFNKPTLEVKGEEEVTQPEPTTLDKASYEALLTAKELGYYKLTAKLSISSGKYFNLALLDSEVAGSLVAPREDLTSLEGKYVEVEGYFVYVTGTSTQYVYFIATSINEATLADEVYVKIAKEDISKLEGTNCRTDLTLPLESNGCTIAWTSSNPDVIANDGKYTMPQVDTEVTLTATITKGEASEVVAVKVIAKYVDPTVVTTSVYKFGESEDFAKWSNSYSEHTLDYELATVKFASANKQTSTITDAPVTKGGEVVLVLKAGALNTVKWTFKQWSSKAQTAKISYSTDNGTTFKETTTSVSVSGEATDLEYICGEGVNAVKITFSSTNNQVGIVSVEFTAK